MILGQLAQKVNGTLFGDPELDITGVANLTSATPGQISLITKKKFVKSGQKSNASAYITYAQLPGFDHQIVVSNPREALAVVISLFFSNAQSFTPPDASPIDASCKIDASVEIGPHCQIGPNTKIGAHTRLAGSVVIGANCTIGENVVIYPNVTLYNDVVIGNNVIVHSGSVIGSDGFGYYQSEGRYLKVPQVGGVIIEDDVEIGANVCIDRACLGNTVVGRGSKLDNFVHIAHNNNIGENCALAAFTATMGGAKMGDNVQIGGQTGVADVEIGPNSIVAARSGVTKDFPAGSVLSGFPAQDHEDQLLEWAAMRKMVKSRS